MKKSRQPCNTLRLKAEEIVRNEADKFPEHSGGDFPEETRKVLHDLRVHQIELEMQNKELRRTQKTLAVVRERYFDLYDLAPVGYFTLNSKGLVMEANLTLASLLGVGRADFFHKPFSFYITSNAKDIYYKHYNCLHKTGEAQLCELRLRKKDGGEFWAWLDATPANSETDTELCRVTVSDITARKVAEEKVEFCEFAPGTVRDGDASGDHAQGN